MNGTDLELLSFEPGFFDRIWGGDRLGPLYEKDIEDSRVVGEAWLVSDHSELESVVSEGRFAGETLRSLLERHERAILGSRAELTVHGKFPLLLKMLDSATPLSVQVHPDDECAARLGEPDVGKTEMWHVFDAEPESELICGLEAGVEAGKFAASIEDGSVESLMRRFEVQDGTSAFVSAGTVHAIGAGIMLAEIQQNSNITYRIYDWGRVQSDGTPRQLHVEKAREAVNFASAHGGAAHPLAYSVDGARIEVLAACRYFAAEMITVSSPLVRQTRAESFRILVAKSGDLTFDAGGCEKVLKRGWAALVPGCFDKYSVSGEGSFLEYYVPDLGRDIIEPLTEAGHAYDGIVSLGGDPVMSDLKNL